MENEYSQPLYKFTVGLISGRGIGQQGAKVELPEMKTNMAAWDMPWHAKQNMHTVTLLGQNILKLYPLLEIRHQGLRVIIHSDSWLFRSSTPGFSFPWVSTKKSGWTHISCGKTRMGWWCLRFFRDANTFRGCKNLQGNLVHRFTHEMREDYPENTLRLMARNARNSSEWLLMVGPVPLPHSYDPNVGKD